MVCGDGVRVGGGRVAVGQVMVVGMWAVAWVGGDG